MHSRSHFLSNRCSAHSTRLDIHSWGTQLSERHRSNSTSDPTMFRCSETCLTLSPCFMFLTFLTDFFFLSKHGLKVNGCSNAHLWWIFHCEMRPLKVLFSKSYSVLDKARYIFVFFLLPPLGNNRQVKSPISFFSPDWTDRLQREVKQPSSG